MALKDWKKGKYGWKHIKNPKKTVHVALNNNPNTNNDPDLKWIFLSYYNIKIHSHIGFRTKTQALKYARAI